MANRKAKTPQQIVDQTNNLARQFYRCNGYDVPTGYRFDLATHPQERQMWDMACLAFDELLQTDPNDALIELEES